jgi:hypothetical protein
VVSFTARPRYPRYPFYSGLGGPQGGQNNLLRLPGITSLKIVVAVHYNIDKERNHIPGGGGEWCWFKINVSLKQEVPGRTNRLLSLILHGPH